MFGDVTLHLLFWLSLIPFVTGQMDKAEFAAWPVAMYGVMLLCAAIPQQEGDATFE